MVHLNPSPHMSGHGFSWVLGSGIMINPLTCSYQNKLTTAPLIMCY
jgi:hypothetical protein